MNLLGVRCADPGVHIRITLRTTWLNNIMHVSSICNANHANSREMLCIQNQTTLYPSPLQPFHSPVSHHTQPPPLTYTDDNTS
jgi:hypothetical protein